MAVNAVTNGASSARTRWQNNNLVGTIQHVGDDESLDRVKIRNPEITPGQVP